MGETIALVLIAGPYDGVADLGWPDEGGEPPAYIRVGRCPGGLCVNSETGAMCGPHIGWQPAADAQQLEEQAVYELLEVVRDAVRYQHVEPRRPSSSGVRRAGVSPNSHTMQDRPSLTEREMREIERIGQRAAGAPATRLIVLLSSWA